MRNRLFLAWPLLVMSLFACDPIPGDEGEDNNVPELSGDDIIPFKDENFLKALLIVKDIQIYDAESDSWVDYKVDVDTNSDGQISVNEAQSVRGLYLYDDVANDGYTISAMPEIKYFTALEYLDCSYNALTSLDVSRCTALVYLSCDSNKLTSLDISNCTALDYLSCYSNKLTSLDVSRCTALETLYCYYNQLTSLDVSDCTALKYFYCYSNKLASLDISNCTDLKYFYCYNNPGSEGTFTVQALFDNGSIPNNFTKDSWTYDDNTIKINYVMK